MKGTETDKNVPRKAPEEIKKSIEVLRFYAQGATDAYVTHLTFGGKADQEQEEYINALDDGANALAYIEQLEREKQALIYDVRNYGFHLCLTCANSKGKYECAKFGTNGLDHTDDGETVIMRCGHYEWRGITEGKDGNTPEPPKE